MTVRPMTRDELHMVLGWAAEEGWNPGLDDAAAFHAADPEGFLIKEVQGAPVAAISVVNHDPGFAFLGLYLCRPAFRGQGHGIAVWRAGIAHAGARCIGLDGVPDQQANYAKSGFAKQGSTVRYEGQVAPVSDARIRVATASDLPQLIAMDEKVCGHGRRAFTSAWFAHTANRQTLVLADGPRITGFATVRRCGAGCKIGPLHAACDADALALLAANPFGASSDPVYIDVLGQEAALAQLLKAKGFAPVFETARMFTGTPPAGTAWPFQAIATMELG